MSRSGEKCDGCPLKAKDEHACNAQEILAEVRDCLMRHGICDEEHSSVLGAVLRLCVLQRECERRLA